LVVAPNAAVFLFRPALTRSPCAAFAAGRRGLFRLPRIENNAAPPQEVLQGLEGVHENFWQNFHILAQL
jgi:hypothetical protein